MTRPALVLVAMWFSTLAGTAGAASPPSDARQLLDRWLAAQNAHDWKAYEALYADGFVGIKRAGPRMVTLDRAAWMKDRQRMFARPITVEATDVVVAMSDKGVTVRFTQSFSTPTFSDRGPKILALERSPNGLRILREEMLSSRVDAEQRAGTPPLALERFAFVDDNAVVLETSVEVDRAKKLVGGDLKVVPLPAHYADELRAGVPASRVPAAAKALAGRRVRVFGDAGPVCEAMVGTHYSIRVRREAWGESSTTKKVGAGALDDPESLIEWIHLVVEIAPVSGKCGKGRWARAADLPTDVRFVQKERGPAEDAALAAFRALPDWAGAQKQYDQTKAEMLRSGDIKAPAPKRWDELPGALTIESIRAGAGGATLAWVQAFAGEGCGGPFFEFQSALFEVAAAKPAVLRASGTGFDYVHPVALVDLDGDGVEELLADNGELDHTFIDYAVFHLRDGRYRQGQAITHPRTTCHC